MPWTSGWRSRVSPRSCGGPSSGIPDEISSIHGKQLLHRREVIRGIQHFLRINHILNDIQIGVVYCAFAGIAFTTFKNRQVQYQATCIVICRMAQPQFIDSLLSGNPVFIAVTLNLNYLLFRYFQYAFHLDGSFRFGAKVQKDGRDSHYPIRAGPDAFGITCANSAKFRT